MDAGASLAQNHPGCEISPFVKPVDIVPESAAADCQRPVAPDQPPGLNVMAVYQDISSRKRVMELCSRVTRSIGRQSFCLRLWSFRELNEPAILPEAISGATEADVLIVSLRAAEKLHPPFCAWVDGWLSHRRRPDGALIAIIDVSEGSGVAAEHVRSYLCGVAWEARLEFLPREYATSSTDISFETEQIP